MLCAVIYCRCSTEEESQQEALKKQVIEARESAKENGWLLVDEYIESKSGTTAEGRGEYQRLFEDLQTDKFDVVQIKSQDRLMRNTKDWYLFVDRLVTNDKKLYMYMEQKFYTADDALITGIKAILAEEYSKELSKKINNAHKNRQRRGESFILPAGTYGYRKLPDKSIEIVEAEAQVLRLIFHLCQTMGCGRIAAVLEQEGYRDRKEALFQEEAIRRMIRNPIRCGTIVQNKRHYDFQRKQELKMPEEEWVVHKGAIPAIVSEEIWQKANKVMDERAAKYHVGNSDTKSGLGKFELSGKIFCGECGGCYYRTCRRGCKNHASVVEWKCRNYIRYGRKKKGKARSEIQQPPKTQGKGCNNIHLDEEKLCDFLDGVCIPYDEEYEINDSRIVEKALSIILPAMEKDGVSTKKQKIEKDIQRNKMLCQKLMDKLLGEIISNQDYKSKKTELDERMNALQAQQKDIQKKEDMQAIGEKRIKQIKKRLEEDIVKKAAMAELIESIEQIVVFEDSIRICLNPDKHFTVALDKEFLYTSKKEAERERILSYMEENAKITAKEIAKKENIGLSTVNYRIKKLRQQGKVFFKGKGGHGEWVVVVIWDSIKYNIT